VVEVKDFPDFAGIVFDGNTSRVYAIVRNSDKLHIFDWNPIKRLLLETETSPVQ